MGSKTHEIEINGVVFEILPDVDYGFDFLKFKRDIKNVPPGQDRVAWERGQLRYLFENSLWAIVAFVMKWPCAFHPFCIEACVEVQRGPRTNTLDVWARGHLKSTIITCAGSIQEIIRNPEVTICIFSYTKTAALKFFNQIKYLLETSEILKWTYPDILWNNPSDEAPKWSDDGGLFVKRKGFAKEPTLYAAGLIDGMPTGGHFFLRIYDDIMVEDLADSPGMIEKVKERYDLSQNLGFDGGWRRVIGTPYHHEDIIQALRNRKKQDGTPSYHLRLKPATKDGSYNGVPVFVSQEHLDDLKINRRKYSSQQILNPTPTEVAKLNHQYLVDVEGPQVPPDLYRFMVIDPAGERKDRPGDAWAILVVGVDPYRDDIGASDVYLIDAVIEEMSYYDALDTVVKMYMRNGRILQLGVEKVALSTTELHVSNALRSKGKHLSVEAGNLTVLRPGGRSKVERIESNLIWPLNNGKIRISKAIPAVYRDRLRTEMERFPMWHDDGIDALSYVYDLLKDYRFGTRAQGEKQQKAKWLNKMLRHKNGARGWMTV